MTNREELKKVIREFGYDEGLEHILIRGVDALQESNIIQLTDNLSNYSTRIQQALTEIDEVIARAQQKYEPTNISIKTDTHRTPSVETLSEPVRNTVKQGVIEQATADTAKASHTLRISPNPISPLEYLSSISDLYFLYVSSWIDVWSTFLIVNSSYQAIGREFFSPQAVFGDAPEIAIRNALAAASASFDIFKESRPHSYNISDEVSASTIATARVSYGSPRKTRI